MKHFSYAVVANYKADSTYNGKSIEEINLMRGGKHNQKAEAETIVQMMEQGGAQMVYHGMSEEDVKNIILKHLHKLSTVTGCEIPVSACNAPDDREAAIAHGLIEVESGWIKPTTLGWEKLEGFPNQSEHVAKAWRLA